MFHYWWNNKLKWIVYNGGFISVLWYVPCWVSKPWKNLVTLSRTERWSGLCQAQPLQKFAKSMHIFCVILPDYGQNILRRDKNRQTKQRRTYTSGHSEDLSRVTSHMIICRSGIRRWPCHRLTLFFNNTTCKAKRTHRANPTMLNVYNLLELTVNQTITKPRQYQMLNYY